MKKAASLVWIGIVNVAALGAALAAFAAQPPKPTKVTWHGHAAFEIRTPSGKVIWIDPWLKNPSNPAAKDNKDPLASIDKGDFIVLTHGHFDHVGDAVELAKKTGARLVTNFELGTVAGSVLGFPKSQMGFDTLGNIGGELQLAEGEILATLVPAIHSSGVTRPGTEEILYGGNPAGVVLRIKNGPTIYHTGDTAYFSDMKLIGERYSPDLALVNIGGHFGMEPEMAAKAAQLVKAKVVVPQHYRTFPVLSADATAFSKAMKGERVVLMEPGSTIEFIGRSMNLKSPGSR